MLRSVALAESLHKFCTVFCFGLINQVTVPQLLIEDHLELLKNAVDWPTGGAGSTLCFGAGTDWAASASAAAAAAANDSSTTCRCVDGYHGADCGVPDAVWRSCGGGGGGGCRPERLRRRLRPRRLIHGVSVNHEMEWLEIRLLEVGDVVDALIVGESRATAGGDAKPLLVLERLERGWLAAHQPKMVHVVVEPLPAAAYADGWAVDRYLRDEMGRRGLERIGGRRADDLFLLLDADEIPSRAVLLFLKLYDGYPQPVALALRWNVYGFFWQRSKSGRAADRRPDVTHVRRRLSFGLGLARLSIHSHSIWLP